MKNLKILLLLLLFSSGLPLYAVDEPIYGYEGYGIASYDDYKELLKHPVLISSRTGTIEGENIAVHASFKFLGIGTEFTYRVYVYFDRNHAESAVNNLPPGMSFLAGLFEGFEIANTFKELIISINKKE